LHQAQVGDLFAEALSDLGEVFAQGKAHTPAFVFGGLDDDW
jgi:hypothetical protein